MDNSNLYMDVVGIHGLLCFPVLVDIWHSQKTGILRSTTSAISVRQVVATLPDRTGNARVIHPTTNMLSIAGSPYIAVNEMLQCSKPFLLGSICSIRKIDAMQQHSEQGDWAGLRSS